MSIHFVKTAVLTSVDGLDFNEETKLANEEAQRVRLAAEAARRIPLYQQLAERKAIKDDEYIATGKAMRAPMRGLESEDLEYFRQLEDDASLRDATRLKLEEEALQSFRRKLQQDNKELGPLSRHFSDDILTGSILAPTAKVVLPAVVAEERVKSAGPICIVSKKRKIQEVEGIEVHEQDPATQDVFASASTAVVSKHDVLPTISSETSTESGTGAGLTALALIGAYNSDSESED
jgi:hypothetical protein